MAGVEKLVGVFEEELTAYDSTKQGHRKVAGNTATSPVVFSTAEEARR